MVLNLYSLYKTHSFLGHCCLCALMKQRYCSELILQSGLFEAALVKAM